MTVKADFSPFLETQWVSVTSLSQCCADKVSQIMAASRKDPASDPQHHLEEFLGKIRADLDRTVGFWLKHSHDVQCG